jgi:hypothetical protein
MKHGNPQLGVLLLIEKDTGCRDRRSGADGDVLRVADEAGDYAGEELFSGVQTN